jgi:flavodoxin
VVYESMFGNSQKVASAIRDGLRQTIPTELVRVGDAPAAIPDDVRLLVVGGPTHELGMSRPSTRAQAAAQGELVMPAELGIREWIGQLARRTTHTAAVTFDTRILKTRKIPGSAARSAAKLLRRRDFKLLTNPASYYVDDVQGPIDESEVERARSWGAALGKQLDEQS